METVYDEDAFLYNYEMDVNYIQQFLCCMQELKNMLDQILKIQSLQSQICFKKYQGILDTLFQSLDKINQAREGSEQENKKLNFLYINYICKNLIEHVFQEISPVLKKIISRELQRGKKFDNSLFKLEMMFARFHWVNEGKFIYLASSQSSEDIIAKSDHPDWVKLKEHIIVIKIHKSLEFIHQSLMNMVVSNNIMSCVMMQVEDVTNQFLFWVKTYFYPIYFYIQYNLAYKQIMSFQCNPNVKTVKAIFGSLDFNKPIKLAISFVLPSIKYSKKIFINRLAEPVSIDWICKEVEAGTLNSVNIHRSLIKQEEIHNMLPISELYKKDHNRIKVRVICNQELQVKNSYQQKKSKAFNFLGLGSISMPHWCLRRKKSVNNFTKVIIHFHGGGWIAMKTFSHQIYTRKWAAQIEDSVIFSVDYRLSPSNAFPDALDDCWQTYLWVLNEASKYFNIDPKQIILAGDSAGGNMCLGLCLLALKHKVRMPDSLVLSYPALDIHLGQFSPGYVYSLFDFILPFTYMKLIVENYIQDQRLSTETNPLISPLSMQDQILKLLPKIRIFCGEDDCLKDNCIRFTNRLVKLGNDVQLTIYRGISHGYLNWDFPCAMKLIKGAILDTGRHIQQLFDNK